MKRLASAALARLALLLLVLAALIAPPAEAQIGPGPSGGGGGGTPGGSSGQIQYNNAGAFGGRAPSGNGTTIATTTGTLTPGDLAGIDANGNIIDAGQSATPQFNNQTGTSYTIACSDLSKIVTLSNASPVAVTLPQAGTSCFTSGFFLASIQNLGAGLVTITPTTSTINNAATATLATNQSLSVVSNGTNYLSQGASTVTPPGGSNGQFQVNNSGAFGGASGTGPGTLVATAAAAGTSGNCVQWASGNMGDAGAACGGGGAQRLLSGTAGNFIGPIWPGAPYNQTVAYSTTVTYYCPFYFDRKMTLEGLSFYINTVQTSGDNSYFGLYANSAGNAPTGAPLWTGSTGSTSLNAVAFGSLAPATYQVSAGWYWIGWQFSGSVTIRTKIPNVPGLSPFGESTSATNAIGAVLFTGKQQSGTTAGTMPNPPGTLSDLATNGLGCPVPALQYLSIP